VDSEIVDEDDDGVWGYSPSEFMGSAPSGRFGCEAPRVKYFYLSESQFCLHFHT